MEGSQYQPSKAPNLSDSLDRLRQGSRKVTNARQAILQVLARVSRPLTMKEILREMPQGSCDLATIYRSVHLLEGLGMVQRCDFGDRVRRFELVREGLSHCHHLICTRCSGVVQVAGCWIEELDGRVAEENGFKRVTHRLEFFGICPACQ